MLSVQLKMWKKAGSQSRDHTPSRLPGIPARKVGVVGKNVPEVIPGAASCRAVGAMRNEHRGSATIAQENQ